MQAWQRDPGEHSEDVPTGRGQCRGSRARRARWTRRRRPAQTACRAPTDRRSSAPFKVKCSVVNTVEQCLIDHDRSTVSAWLVCCPISTPSGCTREARRRPARRRSPELVSVIRSPLLEAACGSAGDVPHRRANLRLVERARHVKVEEGVNVIDGCGRQHLGSRLVVGLGLEPDVTAEHSGEDLDLVGRCEGLRDRSRSKICPSCPSDNKASAATAATSAGSIVAVRTVANGRRRMFPGGELANPAQSVGHERGRPEGLSTATPNRKRRASERIMYAEMALPMSPLRAEPPESWTTRSTPASTDCGEQTRHIPIAGKQEH